MAKAICGIPLSRIRRVEIYINESRNTLAEIKAATGADYVLNGGLFEGTKAVCHLKGGGRVWASDPYTYWGYAWDTGPDIALEGVPTPGKLNYICCVCLLRDGQPERLIYGSDLAGRRPRSAMGLKNGDLCFYCSTDGATPEELQAELLDKGWESAVMLDGGGSSQCDLDGQIITASRKVHNLICVYLEKKEGGLMSDKKIVCLDPGHGPDTVNGSPDGSYKEKEFTWDLYERLRALLEDQGVEVVCTRTEDAKPSLTARAEVSNAAGADCFVSLHTNAAGDGGWYDARGLEIYTSSGPMTAPRNVLATDLVNQFYAAGVILRSTPIVHRMDLTVLTKTDAPAVLIEYGFHTNREDVALLSDSAYRDTLALATAKGVCAWLGVDWKGDAETVRPEDLPDPWAADAWTLAHYKGILDGTRPRDPVTRQELAVVLERLGLLD